MDTIAFKANSKASAALSHHGAVLRSMLSRATFAKRKPRVAEARRRLKAFVAALQMKMPQAVSQEGFTPRA